MIKKVKYYNDNKLERRIFSEDIQITIDENNFVHSYNDKPAFKSGIEISYWKHGIPHRLTGPAKIISCMECYYIEGERILNKEEFENRVNRIQLLNEI